jgi:NAD(P)-dependent dehydrogenase (short-subunit alcohol dehydrogenase family)
MISFPGGNFMRLKDKVAIVTGGGAGMGEAVAKGFAREGARVVIAERNAADGQAVVQAIRDADGDAVFIQVDVSRVSQVEAMTAEAIARYGQIDVLYNNAGVQLHGQDARAHEVSEEIWDRTFSINLKGVWLCSKYVIPHMIKQGGGSIIHVASPTGLTGCAPGYTAYSTSKGGVFGLTHVMAVDYARDNIRVNAVVPGATATPLIAEMLADEQTRQALANLSPLGRLGQPEDVVGLAIFLASDESSFCTGGHYMADGGLTAI